MRVKFATLLMFFILLPTGFFGFADQLNASTSLIISEIATAQTGFTKNEFIELYNLTEASINLSGYKLKKKTKSGIESYLISPSSFIGNVPARRYFLISSSEYKEAIAADLVYSGAGYSIADDNTILLYDTEGQLIDKVGYGLATDFETQAAINPSINESIERKNFIDTDNNYEDFNLPALPSPRNSSWEEPGTEPDPEPIPEPEPEPEPEPVYSDKIRINELFPNPPGSSEKEQEFVEFYNFGEEDIDLDGWILQNNNSETVLSGTVRSKDYLASYGLLTLHNGGDEINLLNPKRDLVFSVSYGDASDKEGTAYAFEKDDWKWTSLETPGEQNEFDEEKEDDDKDIVYGVVINEILPNPKGAEENLEYIELINNDVTEADIGGWILKDKTSTQYTFSSGTKIKIGEFLLIYRKDFKFAMNNSGEETIHLLNPAEKIISSVSYDKSKEEISYNFDGSDWHWSRFLTPGEENKFNSPPEVSKKKDNKLYVGVYADFSAKGYDKDKDKLKFTWDFGDGHKSYKKETRHKYKKAGKYKVTLKVSDGSEDKIETFKIEVKKFPKRKVKILSVSPNPKGKDSKNEYIVVKNNSSKKVDLKDWSIATGSKKLSNHPIKENIIIKPGKTAIITRDDSKFSLGNKKAKIELRYPNGKVAYKLKYDKKKESVKEDEIYTKESGKWAWVAPKTETKLALTGVSPRPVQVEVAPRLEEEMILASGQNFSEDENLRKITLANFEKPQGIVLGAATFRPIISNVYLIPNKTSYLEIIFDRLNSTVNYFLNSFLFFFN